MRVFGIAIAMPEQNGRHIASCRHQLLPFDNAGAEFKKQIHAGKKRSLSLPNDGLSGMTTTAPNDTLRATHYRAIAVREPSRL